MNFADVLASGIGSRMERSVPKQLLDIAGVPIVAQTLRTFFSVPCVDHVVLAMNPLGTDHCYDLLHMHGYGNYMPLPQPEKRITHPSYRIYWEKGQPK